MNLNICIYPCAQSWCSLVAVTFTLFTGDQLHVSPPKKCAPNRKISHTSLRSVSTELPDIATLRPWLLQYFHAGGHQQVAWVAAVPHSWHLAVACPKPKAVALPCVPAWAKKQIISQVNLFYTLRKRQPVAARYCGKCHSCGLTGLLMLRELCPDRAEGAP